MTRWETRGTDGDARVIDRLDRRGKRRTIAHVYGDTPGQRDQRARLMVAAPDLLEALIRLREWIRHPGEDDGPENEAVIYQAEAAIAKATKEVTP